VSVPTHTTVRPSICTRLKKHSRVRDRCKKESLATDMGLEPTTLALGGPRATIAPTGQLKEFSSCDSQSKNYINDTVISAGPTGQCRA
jgi:hypothetical protein